MFIDASVIIAILNREPGSEELVKRQDFVDVLGVWQEWWRDVSLVAAGCDELVVNSDRATDVHTASKMFGFEAAERAVREISDTRSQLQRNVNARLAIEVLLLNWEPA